MTRWFEDIAVNEVFHLGSHLFSAQEIIDFATEYDPQYFHIDPEAARHSHFGGLIASGWHTVCVGQRKMIDALSAEEERLRGLGQKPGVAGPSPGVNAMTFTVPVRPGDTVTFSLTVTNKRRSNSIPGWGVLFNQITAANQRGETVYTAELISFSKLRDYTMPARLKLLQGLAKVPLLGRVLARMT
ncbi:MaoC family dehydratase [Devosia rhodophyticola]|uniref:MaoC family dehydratase n=1 Tax=Devosia rhodophyticola TaxID=3026423 RepID=A0ABY7YV60_9HYPH|nr:MaoC family dehydratase [Devosia rhodophyticola]WDR05067.1 MaoC family dehydratase [Devosia rhodophyticola]